MLRIPYIRLCLVFLLAPTAFSAECPGADLRDTSLQADYLVVAPSSFCALAETLAVLHRDRDGLRTMVVCIDSVTAQFGRGVTPDTALRAFLRFANAHWASPAPRYVVLAGNVDRVPSHPEAESLNEPGCDTVLSIDRWLVESPDGIGDPIACVGRLPAWDSLDFAVMVRKVVAYQREAGEAAWCARAVSLADYDAASCCMFEYDAQYFQGLLRPAWMDTVSVDIRGDSPCHLQTDCFMHLWDEGASILTYCGHADALSLSATRYFTSDRIDSLVNGCRLPVCLLGGCDLSYDAGPQCSIPTHLMERAGGGAVAVVSSVGLMYECDVVSFLGALIRSLAADPRCPLGVAFDDAARASGGGVFRRFTLLGDPAMSVKRASPVSSLPGTGDVARSFGLAQNFPNPFNPVTTIRYSIPVTAFVTLVVYDLLGREVRCLVRGSVVAGEHTVLLDATGLPSGPYFYRLRSGGRTETRKLIVLH